MTLDGCFVTGTDTGVGKTRVSTALLRWFAAAGWRSVGFKPVAAGTDWIDGVRVNDDVRALRLASSVPVTDAEVGPCQFDAACAPHIAAALEGRRIDRGALREAAQALARRADRLVAEGAGGFVIPLGLQRNIADGIGPDRDRIDQNRRDRNGVDRATTDRYSIGQDSAGRDSADWDSADLACDLGLPVVLVVGLRLGCLNHALLTADAIRRRGLRLAGWIGNAIDPDMRYRDENIATLALELERRHGAPCLGVVPWLASMDAAAVLRHLDDAALRSTFAPT